MSTVTVTYAVEAPVGRVWQVFTDLPARVGWLTSVVDVAVDSAGPFDVGTSWRETRMLAGGERVTEEFHVTECRPYECCVIASPGVGADYRMTYTFADAPGAATVVSAVQEGGPIRPGGRLLVTVLGGLAARTSEGALRQDLADLATAAARPAGAAA